MELDQVKVGIDGLDFLLQGGFIRGSTVVLAGPVGTLKSHIGFHFIYSGLKNGEKCFCFSTNQDLEILSLQLKINYGWDLKQYVNTGMLDFFYYSPVSVQTYELTEFSRADVVKEVIYRVGGNVSRVLINTLSQLFTMVSDERLVLNLIYRLKAQTRKIGAIALFVVDSGVQSESVEENVKSMVDYVLETREHENAVEIKLAKSLTKHDLKWHKVYLLNNGVHVE
ncbi:MAG: ATPase domain-containing protein [Candidatus Bathyarchaeia archaeon]